MPADPPDFTFRDRGPRGPRCAGPCRIHFANPQRGDVFVNVLTAAQSTRHAQVGTLLVNPVTRHPGVVAASAAAVDMYAPGRVLLGVGSRDTAVWQVGLRLARLAEQEAAVRMIRALLAGEGVPLGWTAPSRLQTRGRCP